MEPEAIVKIISAITALVGACIGVVKVLPIAKAFFKKRTIISELERLHAVYSAMEGMQDSGAERVIIFAGHNCGGMPCVGRPFYVSAIHWALTPGHPDRIGHYANISVDAEYIRMLITLGNNGVFRFKPDAAPDCLLRTYYRAEGICDSYIFLLGTIDNSYLYVSASSYVRDFTETEVTKLGLLANQIAHQLK